MPITSHTRGQLTTLEWQAAVGDPQRLAVVLHGYGSNADDLIGLGSMVGQAWYDADGPLTRWVAVNAPLQPDEMRAFGGRAWWPLRLAELVERLQAEGGIAELVDAVPPGMDEARTLVDETVDKLHRLFNLDWRSTLVAGFSQGAMLGADLTIRTVDRPAGLITLSGALLAKSAWEPHLDGRCCPVFGSHGRFDPVLPFVGGELLSRFLADAGYDTTFVPFDGDHTVPPQVLAKLLEWLQTLDRDDRGNC